MHDHRVRVARALAAVLALACTHPQTDAGLPPPESSARTVIEVENNTTLDLRIYVVRATLPVRIGTVAGMSTARLALPPDLAGRDVRLYASPVGGRVRSGTETFRARPGQRVSWKLDDELRSYRFAIW